MQNQSVCTDEQRRIRQDDLREKEEQEQEDRKNRGFTQVYARGWQRVRMLSRENSGAAGLYAFFAEHIDPSCGAVVCDQQFLADQFGVTTRTIRNWLNYLETKKAVLRIPIAGRVCAYALDPHEVWKGYDTSKSYAAFVTKTLVNQDGEIRRRIKSMFSQEKEQ